MHCRWIRTLTAFGVILLPLALTSGCRPEVRDDQPDTGTMPLLAPDQTSETPEKK